MSYFFESCVVKGVFPAPHNRFNILHHFNTFPNISKSSKKGFENSPSDSTFLKVVITMIKPKRHWNSSIFQVICLVVGEFFFSTLHPQVLKFLIPIISKILKTFRWFYCWFNEIIYFYHSIDFHSKWRNNTFTLKELVSTI